MVNINVTNDKIDKIYCIEVGTGTGKDNWYDDVIYFKYKNDTTWFGAHFIPDGIQNAAEYMDLKFKHKWDKNDSADLEFITWTVLLWDDVIYHCIEHYIDVYPTVSTRGTKLSKL